MPEHLAAKPHEVQPPRPADGTEPPHAARYSSGAPGSTTGGSVGGRVVGGSVSGAAIVVVVGAGRRADDTEPQLAIQMRVTPIAKPRRAATASMSNDDSLASRLSMAPPHGFF